MEKLTHIRVSGSERIKRDTILLLMNAYLSIKFRALVFHLDFQFLSLNYGDNLVSNSFDLIFIFNIII